MSRLWTWILDLRININSGLVFLAHTFTYSVSPVIKDLVELDRQNEEQMYRQSKRNLPYESLTYPVEDIEEDRLSHYLTRPTKLIKLIKRYHGVGNLFFFVAFSHTCLLTYLGSKAFFQALIIGSDKELASYYSSLWYPRLFDSYPNPESFYNLCFLYLAYYVTFRFLCIHRLIKYSILNRNGYKHITVSQSNLSIAGLYNWTLRNWILFVKKTYNHLNLCAADNQVKRDHLSFDTVDKDKLTRSTKRELIYYSNPIDFSKCYGELRNEMIPFLANSWSKHWYYPNYNCRHDLADAGRFFTLQTFGGAALLAIVPIVCLATLVFEMGRFLPNAEQATIGEIIAVFPEFITNLSAVIKYVDVLLAILVQIPNHVEAGRIYWDVIVMVSRTRKVHEALSEDLDFCLSRARQYKQIEIARDLLFDGQRESESLLYEQYDKFVYDSVNRTEKKKLNDMLEMHIRLAQILIIEFLDLKSTHTLYLNLLFVGNGLCISVCISLILLDKSFIVTLVLGGLALSCFVPIVGIIYSCVKCELNVS